MSSEVVLEVIKIVSGPLAMVATAVVTVFGGVLVRRLGVDVGDVTKQQKRQSQEMSLITQLTALLVSDYQRTHLSNLDRADPFEADINDGFVLELEYLLASKFIDRQPGQGLTSIRKKIGQKDNVKTHFHITERGREYLSLLRRLDHMRDGMVTSQEGVRAG
jgi:hypothetical protein